MPTWSENHRKSSENHGEIMEQFIRACDGHFCAIFVVNMIERIAPKTRSIILLHFGLVTFRIHYAKTEKRKPITSMIVGCRVHDFPNQHFHLWRHQDIRTWLPGNHSIVICQTFIKGHVVCVFAFVGLIIGFVRFVICLK